MVLPKKKLLVVLSDNLSNYGSLIFINNNIAIQVEIFISQINFLIKKNKNS